MTYRSKIKRSIREKRGTTARYMDELDFIYENKYRNNLIKKLCSDFPNNVLVLINHLNQGELISDMLARELPHKQVEYIIGDKPIEEREDIKAKMEQCNNIVLVAMSKIFSTGINVKNIHMIMFAAGGKSFIRTVQSIGRGLRLLPTKDKTIIIDIHDNLEYGNEHAAQRQTFYTAEKIKFSSVAFVEKP